METVSNFIQEAGAKLGFYFLYICAQILVLASLLLTTTGIAVHIVLMIITIGFYFATALKDPGVYVGAIQPNHQDTQVSPPQIKVTKQKSIAKKWQSQKQFGQEDDIESGCKKQTGQVENKEKSAHLSVQEEDVARRQKKPSISEIVIQKEEKQVVESSQEHKGQSLPAVSVKKMTKNEILNKALTLLNNFTLFRSKKEIQSKKQPEQIEIDKNKIIEDKMQENIQKLEVPVQLNQNQLSKFKSKQHGINSMIGRQDFAQLQIQSNLSPEVNLNRQKLSSRQYQPRSIVERVAQIKRYCRICEIYQPLRVRHCHTCDKCIATFDHHCPWMGNCIAEKNKLYFIIYLIFQTVQLFTIMVDLIRFLSVDAVDNSGSVGILLTAVILIFSLMVILLCFHLYLVAKNITTWQLLRWDKIQYLNIFDKTRLISPFDKGVKENLKKLWQISKKIELQDWQKQLTQELSQFVIRKKKHTKTQIEPIESDRRPFKSQKLVRF